MESYRKIETAPTQWLPEATPPAPHLGYQGSSSTHSLLGFRLPALAPSSNLIPSFQLSVLLDILSCCNCVQWQGPCASGIGSFKP